MRSNRTKKLSGCSPSLKSGILVEAVHGVVEMEEGAQLGAQWLHEVAAQLIAEAAVVEMSLWTEGR